MTQSTPQTNHLKRLSTLIDGYHGYRSTHQRVATSELFEAFLSEKLKTILKIIEDKYADMASDKKNLHLLIPLSNIVKNLTDAFHYATYERSQRIFFLSESFSRNIRTTGMKSSKRVLLSSSKRLILSTSMLIY